MIFKVLFNSGFIPPPPVTKNTNSRVFLLVSNHLNISEHFLETRTDQCFPFERPNLRWINGGLIPNTAAPSGGQRSSRCFCHSIHHTITTVCFLFLYSLVLYSLIHTLSHTHSDTHTGHVYEYIYTYININFLGPFCSWRADGSARFGW